MASETDERISTKTLKKYFGYKNFLGNHQLRPTKTIFKGEVNVYLNLPPGDGKSLCFQLPTVLKSHTLSIVFVPRDCLAKDQILFLRQRGIHADYVCTRSCKKRLETTIGSFQSKKKKKIQFLYVLVQKQSVDLIKDWIIELNARNALSYIVFDEAHCASPLSHDYLPAYRDAAELVKETCPNVCKIAITATATTEVRRDIVSELGMKNSIKFHREQDRRNSYHDVHFIDTIENPLEHLKKFIDGRLAEPSHSLPQVPQVCGIIFCRRRLVVKDTVEYLTSKNILAAAYHGGLSLNERECIHAKWANGEIPVMVTTHTFGIGLHKPNVRFVVHWNLPLSFQQMYQENGRVSRDREQTYCRLYYSYYEEESITTYLKSISIRSRESVEAVARKLQFFEEVVNYCFEISCRHVAYHKYFQKPFEACGNLCDACSDVEALRNRIRACLRYRAMERKGAVDKLSYEKVQASALSLKTKPDCTANINNSDADGGPTQSVRYRSLKRLIQELMENYKKNRREVEKNISELNVTEIAIGLEYQLYNGVANRCSKYNHHVVLAVFNIRRATEAGVPCIHFVAQGKYVFDRDPKVIVHPTPVIEDCITIID